MGNEDDVVDHFDRTRTTEGRIAREEVMQDVRDEEKHRKHQSTQHDRAVCLPSPGLRGEESDQQQGTHQRVDHGIHLGEHMDVPSPVGGYLYAVQYHDREEHQTR